MRSPDWECWPDLRVTVRPLPWTWHLVPQVYVDSLHGWRCLTTVAWLFLTVEWWGQDSDHPTFPFLDAAEPSPVDPMAYVGLGAGPHPGPPAMTGTRDTGAQDRELAEVYGIDPGVPVGEQPDPEETP